MRWLWIDRIIELVPGKRMVAIKNVSLAEEHLHDHFPACGDQLALPVMPASLIIEGMAQTAGILVGSMNQFQRKVILAKIVSATLDAEVFPGQSIRYEATLERIDHGGASTSGIVSRFDHPAAQWRTIGRIDLIFSHIENNISGLAFPEENFVFGENFRLILGQMREVRRQNSVE